MSSNFVFLKKVDTKLFEILFEAEKLYKDKYYNQSIIQVRKFGELAARRILGARRTTEESFDDILATLKDILTEKQEDKELIDDFYFIKKEGNNCAHNLCDSDPIKALECLRRAFEISINYSIKNNGSKKVLDKHFDEELLITGKKSKEKYQKTKTDEDTKENKEVLKKPKKQKSKTEKIEKTKKSKKIPEETKENRFLPFAVVFIFVFLFILMVLFILPTV